MMCVLSNDVCCDDVYWVMMCVVCWGDVCTELLCLQTMCVEQVIIYTFCWCVLKWSVLWGDVLGNVCWDDSYSPRWCVIEYCVVVMQVVVMRVVWWDDVWWDSFSFICRFVEKGLFYHDHVSPSSCHKSNGGDGGADDQVVLMGVWVACRPPGCCKCNFKASGFSFYGYTASAAKFGIQVISLACSTWFIANSTQKAIYILHKQPRWLNKVSSYHTG